MTEEMEELQVLEPMSEPESISVPVSEPPSDYEPDASPDSVSMEVILVDELLERLSQLDDDEPEKAEESVEGDLGEVQADVPVTDPDPVVVTVEQVAGQLVDMIGNLDRMEEHLEVIEQVMDHPALTTSFQDYTVTEALLLLLLLAVFISACARMLRGGFSWLRS